MKSSYIKVSTTLFVVCFSQLVLFSTEQKAQITDQEVDKYIQALPKLLMINDVDSCNQLASEFNHVDRKILTQFASKNGFRSWPEFLQVHTNIMRSVAVLKMKTAVSELEKNLSVIPEESQLIVKKQIKDVENQIKEINRGITPQTLNIVKPHVEKITNILCNKNIQTAEE